MVQAHSATIYVPYTQAANRLLALNFFPQLQYKPANSPAHTAVRTANRLTPPSMPMPLNIGRPTSTATKAKSALATLLAAKMLAA